MDLFRITPHLERAKALMDSGEDNALRYACLELRFCFEAVAYRQFEQYGDVFPGNMVGIWKPDQIIKLLASFDPHSEQEGELSIGLATSSVERPEEWKPLAKTKAIPWRTFRGFYNKLGSYLHLPAPKQRKGERKPLEKEALSEIVSNLENLAQATAILAVKNVISAKCDCGTTLYVGEREFDNDELVVCGNRKCNSLFIKQITEAGDKVLTRANVIAFKCKCKATFSVLPEMIWAPMQCPSCRLTYRINLAISETVLID